MGGLNSILAIATSALGADTAAIQVTDNNIANANTPGYTREQVSFSEASSGASDGAVVGSGVTLGATTSPVDQLLNLLIQQQTSSQASASASSNILSSVESYFPTASSDGADVGSQLSAFFSSLSALSANPSSTSLRQTAMSTAQSLVSAFNTTSAALQSARVGLNEQVSGDVNSINALAGEIAALNPQIQSAQAAGGNGASTLINQRGALETQLAGLAGISITSTDEGDQVSLSDGTTLVSGSQVLPLSTGSGTGGLTTVVDASGKDITAEITGGDLGGTLATRDQTLPSMMSQLDTLAWNFAQSFNAAQASGYDLDGKPGAALFDAGTSSAGAATNLQLTTTSGDALALSSDGSSGSNGNLDALTAVQNASTSGVPSPTEAYATLVNTVGNAASTAQAQSSALDTSLTQLKDQQSSISGVSTDEESSNLIQFQQAYEAAAEVVTTVQSLFQTTLGMFDTTGA